MQALNSELLAENEKLRNILGLPKKEPTFQEEVQGLDIPKQKDTEESSIHSINKYSTPDEKIGLYLSLFRGRTDVYAKRCYSKKHDSSYYVPACKNEWVRGLCDKTRVKCKECSNRDLLPLTKEVINSHLRNKWEIQCVLTPETKTGLTPENYLILTPKHPDKRGHFYLGNHH